MNRPLTEIASEARKYARAEYERNDGTGDSKGQYDADVFERRFAELIVQEHVDLLRREWYDLNNAEKPEDETPRDVGIRIGKKSEVNVLISKIKKYFEVE